MTRPRGKMPPAVKPRLVTLAAGASLLLCIATVALWVRSYWSHDCVVYRGPSGHQATQWATGLLILSTENHSNPERLVSFHSFHSWRPPPTEPRVGSGRWSRIGFGYESFEAPLDVPATVAKWLSEHDTPILCTRTRRLAVPLWFVTMLFAILPVWKFVVVIRTRQSCPGRCPTCGYDLRATPERCPECGAAPAATAAR